MRAKSMAEESAMVPYTALNVQQNRELNPEAPEYIPILHHATSSSTTVFFYHSFAHYTLLPHLPPPPPPPSPHASFYFQPFIPFTLTPPNPTASFTHIHPNQHRQLQRQSQRMFDQTEAVVHSSGRSRRRRGGGCSRSTMWRVKNGSSTATGSRLQLESSSSATNRATSSSNEVGKLNEDDDDTSSMRLVKYKACRKIGMKYKIQPVEKSVAKTTVMIRNIPSRYTRETMLTFLDRHCMEVNQNSNQGCFSAYDFFYMPMDFKTGLNKSYAFVNFTTPEAVWRFHSSCDSQKWELFESKKIREIAFANLQGTQELIDHFSRTVFACASDKFLPVHFQPPRDGSADVDIVTSTVGKRVN
ncbi:hypothetical protein QQ045_030490 [Rhodiola kirilowii]